MKYSNFYQFSCITIIPWIRIGCIPVYDIFPTRYVTSITWTWSIVLETAFAMKLHHAKCAAFLEDWFPSIHSFLSRSHWSSGRTSHVVQLYLQVRLCDGQGCRMTYLSMIRRQLPPSRMPSIGPIDSIAFTLKTNVQDWIDQHSTVQSATIHSNSVSGISLIPRCLIAQLKSAYSFDAYMTKHSEHKTALQI